MVPVVIELVIMISNILKKIIIVKKLKLDEKNNTEKALIQAKGELESLQMVVNTLKSKIEDQKNLLNNVNGDKETITAENLSTKKVINLLKV